LLVVLVLLSVAASLVVPRFSAARLSRGSDADALQDVTAVIANARRTAIRGGVPVRLRVASDGVWAVVAARDGEVLDGGRLPEEQTVGRADASIELQIDAMGSCLPGSARIDATTAVSAAPATRPTAFDMLGCRFDPVRR
jgi:type II secretory pathway pseudopilin PulG